MEGAFEFQNCITSSHCTGNAKGKEHCFGAGAAETDKFGARDMLDDALCEFDCWAVQRVERRAFGCLCLHRLNNMRVRMADDQRARAEQEVDVLSAVDIDNSGTTSPRNDERTTIGPLKDIQRASGKNSSRAPNPPLSLRDRCRRNAPRDSAGEISHAVLV